MAPKGKQSQPAEVTTDLTTNGKAIEHYAPEDLEDSGFQDMGAEDMQIPFLAILQKGSPQVEEDGPKYVDGAKPGMLINTVTLELFDAKVDGVRFIPVHREHKYLEWVPRDSGGGLVNTFNPEDPFVLTARKDAPRFGKIELESGNDLVETFNVYGLVVSEDGTEHAPVLLTFSSTQIKHYKRWMTQARSITVRDGAGRRLTPPLYAHVYRLRTSQESNAKGTWYGWAIRLDASNAASCRLPQEGELYNAAKDFRTLVTSGAVKAATESLTATESATTSAAGPGQDTEF
jgi:hypothetical protein